MTDTQRGDSGTYSAPCPTCGGVVEWGRIEGSLGANVIHCTKCDRVFTNPEWAAIELGRRAHEEGSND